MSTPTTYPMLSMEDRQRDPLLKTMLSAGDLFGGMLAEPSAPKPSLASHPTKGVCKSCKQPIPNAWFGFVGGWCAHHRCDSCARVYKVPPQPIKQYPQHADRTQAKEAP